MSYGDEKKEKLDKLERKLYSRNAPSIINGGRTDLAKSQDEYAPENSEVKESWDDMKKNSFDELASKISNMAQKKNRLVQKIFLFSVLFFVFSAGVAAFVFLGGINMVSSKNVDIKIVGPMSVGSGQETSFDINVINNNNVALNSVSLLVEYATGTRYAADLSKELTQERFSLDTIKPGKSSSQNVKAVFFGDKGSSKEIKISLEYKVENSSALFYKEKTAEVAISSAPVIITPIYPKEVNSGQDITFNIEVASNSQDTIGDFLVRTEYPFGFVFQESSPKASFGNNVWQLTDLKTGEKKRIAIRGNIVGQDDEERVFRISAGTASADDERAIAVPFSELMESITVKKPFINLDVLVGGESKDFVGQGGSQVETEVTLRNNLPSRLFNTAVTVSFKGGAFDGSSVRPGNGGFFQSSNNTILWDERSVPELAEIGPGEQKSFSFSLTPLLYGSLRGGKPEIEMTVTARGERISDSGSSEPVSATETRKITLGTDISLSARTARSAGNIENSGPIPPKAGTPTTYTGVWSITNSLNQVSNVTVKATLPPYVKWTNIKSPSGESLAYNATTHELVWNAGSVLPTAGSAKKEVYFQLEFLPSTSQVGQTVPLTSEVLLSGIDKATGQKIERKASAITTNFSGDGGFKAGDDKVVQ